jgi:nucleotide-binding universal stress UspA family protein
MHKYQKILVGIDFSPASRAAFQTAIRFSSYHGGNVAAVHVVDASSALYIKNRLGFSEAEFREVMRERLSCFIAECQAGTFYLDLRIEVGNPADCLHSACDRLEADLLVLGNNGVEHRSRALGEVAAAFARKAPVDVLLVREGQNRVFHQIVACVDFSQESKEVLADARHIAESDRADLDCLYIYRSAVACALPYDRHLAVPSLVASSETLEGWRHEMNDFVGRVAPKTDRFIQQNIVLEHASVPGGICGYADYRNADLVVLGRSRKIALCKMALGTAAEEVVRHTSSAVLVVSPEHRRFGQPSHGYFLPNSMVAEHAAPVCCE